MSTKLIQITREEYLKSQANLVKLLRTLESGGTEGFTTRELCDKAFNNRRKGVDLLREAEKYEYVLRYEEKRCECENLYHNHRGRYFTRNILTSKGKELLDNLEI